VEQWKSSLQAAVFKTRKLKYKKKRNKKNKRIKKKTNARCYIGRNHLKLRNFGISENTLDRAGTPSLAPGAGGFTKHKVLLLLYLDGRVFGLRLGKGFEVGLERSSKAGII
jgi:hypothetical protein